MNKIAIVTSLCGNNEKLHNPLKSFPNADYHAFVDNINPQANQWNQHKVACFSNDPKYALRRNAKPYKIIPQLFIPGYEYYIWKDVSHDVVCDPQTLCETYLGSSDIACFRHTQRSCIYEEAKVLKELNYDHAYLIDRQIEFYRSKNFPTGYGMFEMSAFIRRNTDAILNLELKWWDNICKFSSRDQLSFMFSLWETGIVPTILPGYANGFNQQGGIGNNAFIPQTRHHISSGVR